MWSGGVVCRTGWSAREKLRLFVTGSRFARAVATLYPKGNGFVPNTGPKIRANASKFGLGQETRFEGLNNLVLAHPCVSRMTLSHSNCAPGAKAKQAVRGIPMRHMSRLAASGATYAGL
jgi:hypothetical protein